MRKKRLGIVCKGYYTTVDPLDPSTTEDTSQKVRSVAKDLETHVQIKASHISIGDLWA